MSETLMRNVSHGSFTIERTYPGVTPISRARAA